MPSHIEWVREYCLSLPHTTEDIQWGNALLFRIARKIYCLMSLEPQASAKFSFKCTPEKFAELVEIEGMIPAPYMARNHWVAVVDPHALRQPEIKELIRNSHALVFGKLPGKTQRELNQTPVTKGSQKSTTRKRIKQKAV